MNNLNTSQPQQDCISANEIWKKFHHVFFSDIQALIICLKRFHQAMQIDDILQAREELLTASNLLRASGAAMTLAGSFTRQGYEADVRLTMMPPNVQSDNFSGLMSYDHAVLMSVWKQLTPHFRTLPLVLESAHLEFVAAYQELATGHRQVCEKFGGGDNKSLRSTNTALDTLDKFAQSRLQTIDPNHLATRRCPFHQP
jgi:hypothetical protein